MFFLDDLLDFLIGYWFKGSLMERSARSIAGEEEEEARGGEGALGWVQ